MFITGLMNYNVSRYFNEFMFTFFSNHFNTFYYNFCCYYSRHDIYKTQFRAMFAMNCYIVPDEVLKYETKNKSKKRRKKEGPGKLVPVVKDSEDMNNKELEVYNPVKCGLCDTELAVYDKSEIYHFHNVLESLS